eukprot:11158796-Lingulodinium_polyedra.AAC.1
MREVSHYRLRVKGAPTARACSTALIQDCTQRAARTIVFSVNARANFKDKPEDKFWRFVEVDAE